MISTQLINQISTYIVTGLSMWLIARCAISMLRYHYEPEVWGYLELPDGHSRTLHHWEVILGRSSSCDIVLDGEEVERSHATLMRDSGGQWHVSDLGSKAGTFVNHEQVTEDTLLQDGDTLRLGSTELHFLDLDDEQRSTLQRRRNAVGSVSAQGSLGILTGIQWMLALQLCLVAEEQYLQNILLSFGFLMVMGWICYFVMRGFSARGFEPEIIALFLTTIGFAVVATAVPEDLYKQCLLFLGALVLFFLLGLQLKELRHIRVLRWPMAFAALGFLALNLFMSETIWGAKNWLTIAGQSLQPSEFVKIAYIYAGAATLDRLFRRRNLWLYIGFSAVIVGALALMGDFGTALVYFTCFLVVSYMRSGSFTTLFLAVGGAVLAVFLLLTVKPYVAARFSTWGHAWETPLGRGYQQVRAMSATASGGLFGRGAGHGWLKDIVAADTDLVFGVVCEELGLIVGLCCITGILLLAVFTVRASQDGRSSYYVIASCATVSIFMAQLMLNVFGSLDILPFTGVTFPFVSKGGSSLISCWTCLAYIKAGDTREGGSFALKRRFNRCKKEVDV